MLFELTQLISKQGSSHAYPLCRVLPQHPRRTLVAPGLAILSNLSKCSNVQFSVLCVSYCPVVFLQVCLVIVQILSKCSVFGSVCFFPSCCVPPGLSCNCPNSVQMFKCPIFGPVCFLPSCCVPPGLSCNRHGQYSCLRCKVGCFFFFLHKHVTFYIIGHDLSLRLDVSDVY